MYEHEQDERPAHGGEERDRRWRGADRGERARRAADADWGHDRGFEAAPAAYEDAPYGAMRSPSPPPARRASAWRTDDRPWEPEARRPTPPYRTPTPPVPSVPRVFDDRFNDRRFGERAGRPYFAEPMSPPPLLPQDGPPAPQDARWHGADGGPYERDEFSGPPARRAGFPRG